ncbi:MAG: hypothetical protein JSS09_04420 [Verrucomicrobia bacterium]|nr:hypothetical protein [Verrucomicrobiota bacterium]
MGVSSPDFTPSLDENFYYSFPSKLTTQEDTLIPILLRNEKAAKRLGTLMNTQELSIEKIIKELQEIELMIKDLETSWDKAANLFKKINNFLRTLLEIL